MGENATVLVLETVMEDRHSAGITEYLVTTRCAAQKLMLPSEAFHSSFFVIKQS